jgi:hypothetical protein
MNAEMEPQMQMGIFLPPLKKNFGGKKRKTMAKKKDQAYMLLLGVLLIGAVLFATGNLSLGAGPQPGTPEGHPLITTEDKATVAISCYDIDNGVENGKVPCSCAILDEAGNEVYPLTFLTGGSTQLADTYGFHVGDKVTGRCLNNTDTGYYENRVPVTLTAGVNSIQVPMHKVGTVTPTVTTSAITIGAAGSSSIEYDLACDTQRQYFDRPIIQCKDLAGEGTPIGLGNITSMSCSGGNSVTCDVDAITGAGFCCQLDKEFVSTTDIVSKQKVFFFAGAAADPVGNITCVIFDGVPYDSTPGKASINRANAYDTTNTALSSRITIA